MTKLGLYELSSNNPVGINRIKSVSSQFRHVAPKGYPSRLYPYDLKSLLLNIIEYKLLVIMLRSRSGIYDFLSDSSPEPSSGGS